MPEKWKPVDPGSLVASQLSLLDKLQATETLSQKQKPNGNNKKVKAPEEQQLR